MGQFGTASPLWESKCLFIPDVVYDVFMSWTDLYYVIMPLVVQKISTQLQYFFRIHYDHLASIICQLLHYTLKIQISFP